jgi:hypothetical protein
MAINVDIKKHYENISNWTLGENEPKTNPIKANSYTIGCIYRL